MSKGRSLAAALSLIAGLAAIPSGAARADKATMGLISAGAAFLAYSAVFDRTEGEEPDSLSVGTGVSDPIDREHTAGMFQVEYRPELWGLRTGPVAGLAATLDGRFIGYAGLRHDILFAGRLLVSFNLAAAAYRIEGDTDEVRGLPQFRTGFDIQYKLPGGSKVGVALQHYSNAEVFEKSNPGTETLAFTFTIPLSGL
ncbi:MAG: acyloxyacyl hydrolase [Defluviicoccus sp.]|nr:acyloxyacyl hydrolase [Defluviicoccus sp.]MDE0386753.1 acyloxyacyl hydrolase [Defluviicoccus sp.]